MASTRLLVTQHYSFKHLRASLDLSLDTLCRTRTYGEDPVGNTTSSTYPAGGCGNQSVGGKSPTQSSSKPLTLQMKRKPRQKPHNSSGSGSESHSEPTSVYLTSLVRNADSWIKPDLGSQRSWDGCCKALQGLWMQLKGEGHCSRTF